MVTYTFTNGTVADAAEVNQNFEDVIKTSLLHSAIINYKILENAGTFNNGDYGFVDSFLDTTGVNNTVSSPTTAIFTTDHYVLDTSTDEAPNDTTFNPDSFTSPQNAFDGDDSTYAQKTSTVIDGAVSIGKTFTSKTIKSAYVKCNMSYDYNHSGTLTSYLILQTFDGTTWSDFVILDSFQAEGEGTAYVSYTGTMFVNSNVQGIRVLFDWDGGASGGLNYARLSSLEYSSVYNQNSKITQNLNTLVLDGTEKGLVIFGDYINTSNTSVSYDISDGVNIINNKKSEEYIDITSLNSGNLQVITNLSTDVVDETPEVYGVSVSISKI